ncbi:hypothetical protein [Acidithiobacillus sp.]
MQEPNETPQENNNQMFLEKMARYSHSMNGVPVDRVSIPAVDLLRLLKMITIWQKVKVC